MEAIPRASGWWLFVFPAGIPYRTRRFNHAEQNRDVISYAEQIRLGRAKAFLVNTEMSMKEIAYDLGFTHQATFTSSFRRVAGMSPSEYRKAQWN